MDKKDYICIHKRVLNSSVFKDPDVYRVFTWILVNALDEAKNLSFKSKRRMLEINGLVGDCVFIKTHIADETGMTRYVVDRCIGRLEKMEIIRTRKEANYTVATVLNYREYQTVRLDNFCSDPDTHAWYRDEMPNTTFDPRDASFPARLSNARLGSIWVKWCDRKESAGDPLSKEDSEKQLNYILKHCSVPEAVSRLEKAMSDMPSKPKKEKTRSEVSSEISSKPVYSDQFKDFWENYPNVRRGSKTDAHRRFKENCQFLISEEYIEVDGKRFAFESKERAAAFIIARAKVYSTSLTGAGRKYAKGAAAWLNGQNYLDSQESWVSLSGDDSPKQENKFNTWN